MATVEYVEVKASELGAFAEKLIREAKMNLEKINDGSKLRFSPRALTDIKSTWEYLSEQSEDILIKLIKEISQKCKMLPENLKTGREPTDLIIGFRQFSFNAYNIYYFQTESGIESYRVLHSLRDVVQVFDDAIDDAK